METISALILRLQQQSDQQAVPSELLVTVHQLEAALQQVISEPQPIRQVRSGNISVVLPSGNRLHTPSALPIVEEKKPEVPVVPEKKASEPVSAQATKPADAWQPLRPPVIVEMEQAVEPASVESDSVAENFHLSFQKEEESKKHPPSQQMEMNDIFSQSSSLNDRMKGDQKEIASVLHEEPVKDLRRAIGINDRFVYLSELFRGDEVMYERSLKTINNFRIYPEAEYWIERELKVKLGWDESKDAVKQFRQLVRRRFQA